VFSILLIYILFVGGTIYLVYRVYPAIIIQLRDLNEHLPQFISMYEDTIYQIYVSTSFLPEAVHDQMDQLIFSIEKSLENIVGKLLSGFTKIFDFIIIITVIPVLVFYFLKDYHNIKKYMKKFIPIKYQPMMSQLTVAIDERLGSYIRGQLLVCAMVSLFTLIAFHLLGVKYALLLAIIMGLTNIIPYFGPIIGSIPAVAITITVSTKLAIFVIIIVFVIQIVESNFISPYIVGKSMNIHPIAIIFALLLGGQIKGIIGMILAVPALTILKEVSSHLFTFKREN
jgi:predicted PurR-regulated permease PerM